MKKVLLVSAGWIHPPYRGRVYLKDTLTALTGYSYDEVESLAEAAQRRLSEYAALVLYYHHRDDSLTPAELQAFAQFVRDGGGVLALHSATASYKPTLGYFEILGGRFTGHGPVQAIEVQRVDSQDGIFAGVPSFTVTDELYLHELQPDIRVHFTAEHEGRAVPMVWTREVGDGRVCYSCPGHRSASLLHPAVQEILRRGLHWVSRANAEPQP